MKRNGRSWDTDEACRRIDEREAENRCRYTGRGVPTLPWEATSGDYWGTFSSPWNPQFPVGGAAYTGFR